MILNIIYLIQTVMKEESIKYVFFILISIMLTTSFDIWVTYLKGINTIDTIVSINNNDSTFTVNNEYGKFKYNYDTYEENWKNVKLNDQYSVKHCLASLVTHAIDDNNKQNLFNKLNINLVYRAFDNDFKLAVLGLICIFYIFALGILLISSIISVWKNLNYY